MNLCKNVDCSTHATRRDVDELKVQIADLRKVIIHMGEKVLAADAQLEADIQAVADGSAAKDALIAQLQGQLATATAALESADADKAAAVAAQADSDDTADAGVIAAGDAALAKLLAPADSAPSA